MKKRNIWSTLLILSISHICLILLITMTFGLEHPFRFLYRELFPYAYVLTACLMVVPVYMCAGYMFIFAKNTMKRVLDFVWQGCAIFTAVLVIIWCISYVLTISGWNREAWTYYIVANYPIAFLMNHIDLMSSAANNPIYLLPSIVPGIAFFFGAKLRVRVIKGVGTDE